MNLHTHTTARPGTGHTPAPAQALRRIMFQHQHNPQHGLFWACGSCQHGAHSPAGQACLHPEARTLQHPDGLPTSQARAFGAHCGKDGHHHLYQTPVRQFQGVLL